uniref:Uncharacterized protein n=1 Tax=Chromera velia CCMP2878 TaxID=1169474 RepID=A0A0G4F5U9_9ALVE|eukprot:Cvel_2768.t1-p1 / transcript=Cvel_2768.t1 / gene=Cvel_2768 / organism=Chromera_velia_CCMP2878 / gene_product=hypothetical protein / transcript_product=hypothetical protein / location=Cvel_scaffold111:59752-60564(-) / protein_length=271 / sequence_SO=supercontig / SO=protein_coding / is_pseudo=false
MMSEKYDYVLLCKGSSDEGVSSRPVSELALEAALKCWKSSPYFLSPLALAGSEYEIAWHRPGTYLKYLPAEQHLEGFLLAFEAATFTAAHKVWPLFVKEAHRRLFVFRVAVSLIVQRIGEWCKDPRCPCGHSILKFFERRLTVGDRVRLDGLKNTPSLNGKHATVLGPSFQHGLAPPSPTAAGGRGLTGPPIPVRFAVRLEADAADSNAASPPQSQTLLVKRENIVKEGVVQLNGESAVCSIPGGNDPLMREAFRVGFPAFDQQWVWKPHG